MLELIVLAVLGYAAFTWHTTSRGKRFVRAYAYLKLLDNGMSSAEANGLAMRFLSRYSDPDIDLDLIKDATGYTKAGGHSCLSSLPRASTASLDSLS